MFPLLLHIQKRIAISFRDGFLHLHERLLQFCFGISNQSFEGTFIDHRNHSALDATAQQVVAQLSNRGIVKTRSCFPAVSLRLDVRKKLGEGWKFDESMNSECDLMPVLPKDR